MATTSNIQWTEKTWNPITGCSRVSSGCQNCYAEAMAFRLMHMPHTAERYAGTVRKTSGGKIQFTGSINTVPEVLDHPKKWKSPQVVFVNSMSDLFHENVPREYLMEIWKVIRETPQHTYQILTKRPERIEKNLPPDWGKGYENVWLGTSTENQKTLIDRALPLIFSPAITRFLSVEPMLAKVDLTGHVVTPGGMLVNPLHWVIVGGESGRNYRECKIEWIEQIIDDCKTAKIPVFVKQLGTYLAKKMGMKDKKGGDISEWPEHLQVREFPKHL